MAGVIGYPARYSVSPQLHNAAYEAMALDIAYVALPVAVDDVANAVAAIRTFGMVGVSVTIPHKESVIEHLDELSSSAQALNAVNCIVNMDGRLVGHNTDGVGFVRALRSELDIDPVNQRCVVVGAGGAARAVIAALAEAGASDIAVINRSAERGEVAAGLAGAVGRVGTWSDVANATVLINATSVGMGTQAENSPIDASLLQPHHRVFDLVYEPRQTKLMADAHATGAKSCNGLTMLVHQAAVQIEIWTGRTPPIDVMINAVQ